MNSKYTLLILIFPMVFSFGYGQDNCSYPTGGFNTVLGSTINVFDWTQEEYNGIYLNSDGNTSVEIFPQSPFFFDDQDRNLDHLKDPIIKDFHPEDGWELLFTKFGQAGNGQDGVTIPGFVLYNRHESIMRAFFYIPESETAAEGYNKAQIITNFVGSSTNSKESGLFTHFESPAMPLNVFSKQASGTTPNFYSNGGDYWLYADFPVAYDPCTCDHATKFTINPRLLDVQDISLSIDGGGTIAPKKVASVVSGSVPNASVNFTSVLKAIDNTVTPGVKIAKNIDNFLTFTTTFLNSFNTVDKQVNYNNAGTVVQDKVDKAVKKSFKFPSWVKNIPKIGVYVAAAEFLLGGGKKTAKPTISSFEAKLKFSSSGNIIDSDPFDGLDIFTPGSDQSNADPNTNQLPIYNNVLGIFNVLESPRFEYNHLPLGQAGNDPCSGLHSRIRLDDDIKYVINPASGLSQTPVDIKVAIIFETPHEVDLEQSTALTKVEYEGEDPLIKGFFYQTPFIPMSCVPDYIIEIWYKDEQLCEAFDFVDVRFKVLATLKKDPHTNPFYDDEEVMFMATYKGKIGFGPTNEFIPQPETLSYAPTAQIINDVSYDYSQTVYALNTITLGPNIQTNGNEITFIAGEEILGNVTDLPANVNLIVQQLNPCQGKLTYAQLPFQVYSFCNSNKYDPIVTNVAILDPPSIESPVDEFDVEVFPNPFFRNLKVRYNLEKEDKVQLILRNGLGQIAKEKNFIQPAGEHLEMIGGSNLPNGMYYLTFKTTDSIKTVKVSKQSR